MNTEPMCADEITIDVVSGRHIISRKLLSH